MDNYFTKLESIDCNDHVRQKGKFSYLSWAYAVSQLCRLHPSATWEVKRFPLKIETQEGNEYIDVPYLETPAGYFVEVEVTIGGVTRSQLHPVLDHQNKPKNNPSSFDINTSIQRALVKAIALHGLGLYIYANEDLPPDEKFTKPEVSAFITLVNRKDFLRIYRLSLDDQEKYLALHKAYLSHAPQGEKGKTREFLDNGVKEAGDKIMEYVNSIMDNPNIYEESIAEFSDIEADLVNRLLPNDIKGQA